MACKSYPFHELYGNDKVDIKEKQKANFKSNTVKNWNIGKAQTCQNAHQEAYKMAANWLSIVDHPSLPCQNRI